MIFSAIAQNHSKLCVILNYGCIVQTVFNVLRRHCHLSEDCRVGHHRVSLAGTMN